MCLMSPPCGGVAAGAAERRRTAVHTSGSASLRRPSRSGTNTDTCNQHSAGKTQENPLVKWSAYGIMVISIKIAAVISLMLLNFYVLYKMNTDTWRGQTSLQFSFECLSHSRRAGTWAFCFICWQVSQTEVQQGQQQFNQFTDGQVRFRITRLH